MKDLFWIGGSKAELMEFPGDARQAAGWQLHLVQSGEDPEDWKPMVTVGPGVREIRIRVSEGAFRVIYVASIGDAVYVLRCFQKKTQKTSKHDIEVAQQRLKQIL